MKSVNLPKRTHDQQANQRACSQGAPREQATVGASKIAGTGKKVISDASAITITSSACPASKKDQLDGNLNTYSEKPLLTPQALRQQHPTSTKQRTFIANARQQIAQVIAGQDSRLMVICGPCSIHDVNSALAYAHQLKTLSDKVADHLLIVMRVYFEKPRSTTGWKGLINDPNLDGSCRVEKGLIKARSLLCALADMELPVATEVLDPVSPQYLSDLIGWAAIGARTTESQTHRELASGLKMPVGFKNGTDGSIAIAINALKSAASEHRFLGVDSAGQVAVIHSQGNANGHVILRGGKQPNYDANSVQMATDNLKAAGLNPRVLIDCSHGNSNKDPNQQPRVAKDILSQIQSGNRNIMGIMLESHLNAGSQKISAPETMAFGVSVTDPCLGWHETEKLIHFIDASLSQ
jgi:3-deoxy-7-phosphoheptulonate synthase